MSGRLIVRRDDGRLEAIPETDAIRIEGGEYWIQEGRDAAVNGERVIAKRKLRHLDVISVGSNENMIFSTTAIELPVTRPVKRTVAVPPVAAAAPPQMTMVFRASEIDVPDLDQGDADPANTMLGVPPAAIPAFQSPPPEESPNTLEIIRGAAPQPPKFDPLSQMETVVQRTATPTPGPATAPTARVISSVEFRGVAGMLIAPRGRSVIGRGSQATIRIDSEGVSKVHAVVVVTPTEVIITDQNSVNGTTINGSPISQPQKLNDGDRVAFAKVEYRVQFIRGSGVR